MLDGLSAKRPQRSPRWGINSKKIHYAQEPSRSNEDKCRILKDKNIQQPTSANKLKQNISESSHIWFIFKNTKPSHRAVVCSVRKLITRIILRDYRNYWDCNCGGLLKMAAHDELMFHNGNLLFLALRSLKRDAMAEVMCWLNITILVIIPRCDWPTHWYSSVNHI